MRTMVNRTIATLSGIALLGLAGACQPEGDEELVVEQSAEALTSSVDFAFVSDVSYSAPPLLGLVSVDAARTRMIENISGGLELLTASAPCINISTDDTTFVEARFDLCGSGDVPVDGVIRANLDFETRDCLAGRCPTAVTYSLDPVNFTAAESRFDGAFSLRDAVDPAEPMVSTGGWTLTGPSGASVGLQTTTSWLRTGLCLDLSWDATLSLNQEARDVLGTDLEAISASARDVERCLGQCPRQGTVDIAYGEGDIIRVEFDGSRTARVTGPRGFSTDIALSCNAVR